MEGSMASTVYINKLSIYSHDKEEKKRQIIFSKECIALGAISVRKTLTKYINA